MRLRTLLALSFGLLALGLSMAGSLTVQAIAGNRLKARIGAEMAQFAGQVGHLLEANLDERLADLQVLATVARTQARSAEARRTWLDALRRVYPVYAWIGFADEQGTVEASTDGVLEGASVSGRPWFRHGRAAPYLGDIHDATLLAGKLAPDPGGEPLRLVDVSTPVQDEAGAVVGVVGAHLSWRWVSEITRGALGSLQRNNRRIRVVIVSDAGQVLLTPPDLVGVPLPAQLAASLANGTRRDGEHSVEDFGGGNSFLVGTGRPAARTDKPNLAWTVLVLQPTKVALAASGRISREILLGGVAFAVGAAAVGWWLAGRIAAPLLRLSAAAASLDDDHTALPTATGFREVATLTASFRDLLARLAQRDASLAAANRDLETKVAARTADLAAKTAFIRSVVDATPDAVLVVGPDGVITFVNDGAAEFFSGRAAAVGRPFAALWPAGERAGMGDVLATALAGGSRSLTVELPSRGAVPRWCQLSVVPVLGRDGAPDRVLALARDISALKAVETDLRTARDAADRERLRAEAAGDAKAEFLANMSHELRTPLAGMLGIHELLRDDPGLGDAQRRLFGMAHEAGRSLLVIVNDILDVSKIDAGQLAIEQVPFDPRTLAEGCRRIAAEGAAGRGLAVESEVAASVPERLRGDPTRIRQVLLNLATNAAKFTDAGRVSIRLAYGAGRLRCEVSDTGPGIAPDALPRLFDRFTQADSTTARRYGGTGLGLAICRKLTELMGGEIGADSRLGHGSTFWFEMPLEAESPGGPVLDEAREVGPVARRILLADDNLLNQEVFAAVLARSGHHVTAVGGGDEAVREATRPGNRYDVVLMDVQMPGTDGLTATREIRRREAEGGRSRLPVIALTANASSAEGERCRRAGMDGHLGKPVNWAELADAVERAAAPARSAPAFRDPAEPDDAAVMDESVLENLAAYIGRERVGSLLLTFRAETERHLAQIAAEAAEARMGLPERAHTVVSMAGQLGFRELAGFCGQLEASGRPGTGSDVRTFENLAARALSAARTSRFAA